MRPLRVVIVEDDENDLLLMLDSLERFGFEVEHRCVRDAAALREAMENGTWDVVLSDQRLPHFSGSDALDLVRSITNDVPFILVTATLGDERAVEMIRRGADDYVLKDRMPRLGYSVDRTIGEFAARRERAQTQHALDAMQRRFQETFEHAPVGIVHTGSDGRFRLTNDRFCAMVGYTREELSRMTFLDITHPDDLLASVERWEAMRLGGGAVQNMEKRYVRKDGAAIWVELSTTVVRKNDGDVDYTLGMVQEITARKLAEEKIRRQRLLLNAVEQAVIATDIEGRVTYWNRFARDLYGWNEEEAAGHDILEILGLHGTDSIGPSILRLAARGEAWAGELLLARRNGTSFPAMVLVSPIFETDGTVTGMLAVSFDVTEQRAAEAALRRSEQRHRDVFESVVELIISVSPDATIRSVNRAFETATGWTRDEIVGHCLWTCLPADNVESAAARLRQRLEGDDLTTVTGRLLRKDGSALIIDGVACVTWDEDGVAEVFYFLRDITDRTRAEEARARLDHKFRLVLESVHEGIYTVDADSNCTMMNPAAVHALGFTPEEVLGRRIHDIVHGSRADGSKYHLDDCPVTRTLQRGTTERVLDEVYWHKDGRMVPVEYASAPLIENGKVTGAVVTFSDVSERRMLESQLEKANRLNGLGRIAVTIAHEFNNVLMGIQPFVEILRIESRDNPRMVRSVNHITDSVRRGKRVTSEILQFTRQSAPVVKPLDVPHWLADLAAEARQMLGASIDFTLHVEAGLTIDGDSAALQQVFMNMIVNARDAFDGGAGQIDISAAPSRGSVFPFGAVEHGETFAHFRIADNGPGMPVATMQHIFEPLFTTKKSGTGLGLALAHHIVQQHGGSLFVESTEGVGTTFHMFLPLAEEVAYPVLPVLPEAVRPPRLRSVVLVEDDETVAAGMVELLGLEEIRVQVATTGGAALAAIESAQPDAVLLDVGLPDVDGTVVYERIAKRWPAMPVVFATGHADASRLHVYLSSRNVGHVLKPYQLTTLYQVFTQITS